MNRVEQLKKNIESSKRMLTRCKHPHEVEFEQSILDNLYILIEKAETNRLINQQRISVSKLKK